MLASARFQRLALRTPFVRGIARRRARQMFDLVAGFVHTQVLLACVRLELLPWLAEGPRSVAEVAGRITPVPGGVGPLTIAMLMANTVKAARMRRGIDL